jgi:hypothetical protein
MAQVLSPLSSEFMLPNSLKIYCQAMRDVNEMKENTKGLHNKTG